MKSLPKFLWRKDTPNNANFTEAIVGLDLMFNVFDDYPFNSKPTLVICEVA
jgi:hypothetical protein